MGVHWKSDFFFGKGGAWKNNFFLRGKVNHLKRGTWIVCRFKRGLGRKKKKGLCFWGGEGGGVLRPQDTLWVRVAFLLTQISKVNNIVTVLLLIILTIIDN